MVRPSVLHDEATYQEVIKNLALGMPQVLIAESLGISPATLSNWKKRKDFKKALASKILELGKQPIEKVRKSQPLAWLERHPEFREAWAPPKVIDQQLTIQTIQIELPKRLQSPAVEIDTPRMTLPPGEDE